MFSTTQIYEYMKDYTSNKDIKKNNSIEYILECARPFWFDGWNKTYTKVAKSHLEAFIYFYEMLKCDNILMNNKPFDLIEYSMYWIDVDFTKLSLYEIVGLIIGFYFGYDGVYDCAIYIIQKGNKSTTHEYHNKIK
jgi:hypothetical protein